MTTTHLRDTIEVSMAYEDKNVSTFKDLREQTGWSVYELAKEAGVSPSTVNRMEHLKDTVTRRIAYKVLNTISARIGRRINIEDVEGLDKIVSSQQKE